MIHTSYFTELLSSNAGSIQAYHYIKIALCEMFDVCLHIDYFIFNKFI